MPPRVGADAACVRLVDTHTNYIARFHLCQNARSVRPCAWWQLRSGRTSNSPGSGGVSQRSDKRVSHQFVRERPENSVSASRVVGMQGPPHPFFAGCMSVAEKCCCRGEPDSAIGSKPAIPRFENPRQVRRWLSKGRPARMTAQSVAAPDQLLALLGSAAPSVFRRPRVPNPTSMKPCARMRRLTRP